MLDAVVIGAGVSGLTTAVCLAEAGLQVAVWTADPPERTTSTAAGAIWGPYLVEPQDKVLNWSRHSFAQFKELATDPDTGVRMTPGIEASRSPMEPPIWAGLVPDMRRCEDLPDGFINGFRFTVPLIDMPVYLDYLQHRLVAAGGTIQLRSIRTLLEAAPLTGVIVNCTGLGAAELVPDKSLHPIRGQLVIVENPGIDEFFSEDTGLSPDLCCIYPHGATAVLGGSAEVNVWDQRTDPAMSERIRTRCAAIFPQLTNARIIAHRVGLRPTRSAVRVEEDSNIEGARVIHNYGHGGAGVTLSWGCANTVLEAVMNPM